MASLLVWTLHYTFMLPKLGVEGVHCQSCPLLCSHLAASLHSLQRILCLLSEGEHESSQPWNPVIWVSVLCVSYHRFLCHPGQLFFLNLQIIRRGPGGLHKQPWGEYTKEIQNLGIELKKCLLGSGQLKAVQWAPGLKWGVFTGMTVYCPQRGSEGRYQQGQSCSQPLHCAAWVTEGTFGDVPEETSHSINRMGIECKRVKLTSRDCS